MIDFKKQLSKTQLISVETLETIAQGALGGMTLGAYHQYTTNKKIELNNEKVKIQQQYFMDKMENRHKKYIIEMENRHKLLNDKYKLLNDKLEKVVSKQKYW